MKRLSVLILLFAVGCRSQAQPSDPFLRTTVPPPTTGQGAAGGAQPYYTPGAGNSSGGSTSPAGNKYSPPGGSYNYQQTSTNSGDFDATVEAGKQSADALGEQLVATVDALDDPPPSFSRPAAAMPTEPAAQLAANSSVNAVDFSDPPPTPRNLREATAKGATREVVETVHNETATLSGNQNVIRIVGTEIITEPRTVHDEQPQESATPVNDTLANVAQHSTDVASMSGGLKWRKKGL